MISVIIPTYCEEGYIGGILRQLSLETFPHEVVVVDGGSSDRTIEIAHPLAKVVFSKKGRGLQLNEGARWARGDILFFLHGDCWIERGTLSEIDRGVRLGFIGGCLTQRIQASHPFFRLIEWSGNMRARARRVFYGDQGIFVRRDIFHRLGGFRSMGLFEDVEFSRRLRQKGPTVVLQKRLYTSNRRWRRQGIFRTTLINRWLLALFYLGLPSAVLSRWYRDVR